MNLSPQEFVAKWRGVTLKERSASQIGCKFIEGLPLVILILLLTACGGDGQPTPTPTKTAPSAQVVAQATRTPVSVLTDTPSVADNPTSVPVLVPTNTPAPIPTTTPLPTSTSTPIPVSNLPTTNGEANLRSGPGTDYGVVGQAAAGQSLDIVGRNTAGDWYQLASGAWIAGFLVDGAQDGLAVVAVEPPPATATSVPVQPVQAEVQPAAPPPTSGSVSLLVIINAGRDEVLGIRNDGGAAIDISGWRLDGSNGDDFCIIPGGTVLQPAEVFTIATGEAQPQGRGYKCGDKTIWNNEGEIIFLRSTDGQVVQVETR